MLTEHPFFGSLALRLPLVPDRSRQTIASDGSEIRFNPAWVEATTVDQIRASIAHCVLACSLHHHTRRGERDYKLWQRASYEATKPILRDAKLTNDGGGSDDSVERIYERMREAPEQEGQNDPDPQAASQSGDSESPDTSDQSGGNSAQSDDSDSDGESTASKGSDQPSGSQGDSGDSESDSGDDGSDSSESDAPESHDPSGRGEVMDAPQPPDPTEREEAIRTENREWDEARQQAAQTAKSIGNLPGKAVERIRAEHASEIDWRDELREHLLAVAKDDYTWVRPSRRHVADGIYLPSLHSEKIGPIVLCIDTSYSMNTAALAQVWSEIRDLAETMLPERLHVIQCDVQVTSHEEYEPEELPESLDALGRGGTDYVDAFRAIDEIDDTPSVILYFTDLECHGYPAVEPDVPVFWVKQPTPYSYGSEPPFGTVISMKGGR